jgi:alpha-galactosidase
MLNALQTASCQADLTLSRSKTHVIVTSDRLSVECDLTSGLWSAHWAEFGSSLTGVACTAQLQDGVGLVSTDYRVHECRSADISRISDQFGDGIQVIVRHDSPGLPEMRQRFRIYEKLPYFLTSVTVAADEPIASNNIGVISCDSAGSHGAGVHLGSGDKPQTLAVPFDNDAFVRYYSSGKTVSHEVTAIYDNDSRKGLVIGSVTHDVWKTGIDFDDIGQRSVGKLDVYGGCADKETWDSQPHGAITGLQLNSPEVLVGGFADWRAGMEAYGRANALIHPPLPWSSGVPFGWNSWMAYETSIDQEKYLAVSDFFKSSLQDRGFINNGSVYMNLDSFWDNMTKAQMRAAVVHVHANGQKAGIYWTPFVYWGNDLSRPVEGTNDKYTYGDIVLRDAGGRPLPALDSGHPIDPTHPGELERIDWQLAEFVAMGFDYIKLDFMTHGALEGKHYDPKKTTGIEAYNTGMSRIAADLSPAKVGRPIFISLSIAPLFPSGYGHSRRIACDTWGQLSNTEYLLNSLTYGWWAEDGLYRFNDPDNSTLTEKTPTTEEEARSRLNGSVIAGTVLLDSDPLTDPAAQQRAIRLLTNPEINAVARMGRTFRPVEGNTGSAACDTFVLADPQSHDFYVAVFNFNLTVPKPMNLNLTRLGLDGETTYDVRDLWTHQESTAQGTLHVELAPAQSTIFRLTWDR